LLNGYLPHTPAEISAYNRVRTFSITDAEARLLNEIEKRHGCGGGAVTRANHRPFMANVDLIVTLSDAGDFYDSLVTYWPPHQPLSSLPELRQRATKRRLQPQGNRAVAKNCRQHQSA
jgi:hypothetical protein